jgi:hypothetical protein
MKPFFAIALLLAFLLAVGCVSQKNGNAPIVGNDVDSHGCRTSAGYSWCEAKQTCLRIWGEQCTNDTPIACTADAKLCPDGSAVGRQGPNCEFAPCPSANFTLYGKITIGPLCPVEPCNRTFDYSVATVNVYDAEGKTLVAQTNADSSGSYGFKLSQGNYLVNVTDSSGKPFGMPRTGYTQSISLGKGQRIEMNFDIDTGIR